MNTITDIVKSYINDNDRPSEYDVYTIKDIFIDLQKNRHISTDIELEIYEGNEYPELRFMYSINRTILGLSQSIDFPVNILTIVWFNNSNNNDTMIEELTSELETYITRLKLIQRELTL